ncbi:hypothetical protein PISMIDRAFT_20014 [Pisolithus microcarpus 441]|uniref:Uncharacterized protein n=1 Tax=Pisolithus microcarpus 441 TaxID=765257 RepID=A0A0C9Y9X1_9AGAM|nr:hypothetical protein PISMIDRAFT_20014 [Pisolithus microcarpus 441]
MAHATPGQGLMIVMDNNDPGRGTWVECQQVNLCNVDAKFIKGVEEHGLKNCYIKNALNVGIHCEEGKAE